MSREMKSHNGFFYNRVARAIIPAGLQGLSGENLYDDATWTPMKIKLTSSEIIYEKENSRDSIAIKDVYYVGRILEHPKADSPRVLGFNYKSGDDYYIGLIKCRTTRSKEILRRRLLRLIIQDSNVWYVLNHELGEDTPDNKKWTEGIFKIGEDNTLKIEDRKGEVKRTIPPKKLIRLDTKAKLKSINLRVYHYIEDEIHADVLYSTEVPLDLVNEFFYRKETVRPSKRSESKVEMDKDEKKVLMLIGEKEESINSVLINFETLFSCSSFEEEKLRTILESLEEKEMVRTDDPWIIRTFQGLDYTPESVKEDEEENEKSKIRKEKLERLKNKISMVRALKSNRSVG